MTSVLKILHQIILFKGIKNSVFCTFFTMEMNKQVSLNTTPVFQVRHYLKANVHVKKLQ